MCCAQSSELSKLRALWNLGVLCNLHSFALPCPNPALKALVPQQLNVMLDWFLNCHSEPALQSDEWGNDSLGCPDVLCWRSCTWLHPFRKCSAAPGNALGRGWSLALSCQGIWNLPAPTQGGCAHPGLQIFTTKQSPAFKSHLSSQNFYGLVINF